MFIAYIFSPTEEVRLSDVIRELAQAVFRPSPRNEMNCLVVSEQFLRILVVVVVGGIFEQLLGISIIL